MNMVDNRVEKGGEVIIDLDDTINCIETVGRYESNNSKGHTNIEVCNVEVEVLVGLQGIPATMTGGVTRPRYWG